MFDSETSLGTQRLRESRQEAALGAGSREKTYCFNGIVGVRVCSCDTGNRIDFPVPRLICGEIATRHQNEAPRLLYSAPASQRFMDVAAEREKRSRMTTHFHAEVRVTQVARSMWLAGAIARRRWCVGYYDVRGPRPLWLLKPTDDRELETA